MVRGCSFPRGIGAMRSPLRQKIRFYIPEHLGTLIGPIEFPSKRIFCDINRIQGRSVMYCRRKRLENPFKREKQTIYKSITTFLDLQVS